MFLPRSYREIWCGFLLNIFKMKNSRYSAMEEKTQTRIMILGCILGVLILVGFFGAMIIGISGDNASSISLRQVESVPEGAVIIPITEEVIAKYPILEGMPRDIQIRVSLYSEIFRQEFSVDKETGDAILSEFCYTRDEEGFLQPANKYLEYEGEYYKMENPIS